MLTSYAEKPAGYSLLTNSMILKTMIVVNMLLTALVVLVISTHPPIHFHL